MTDRKPPPRPEWATEIPSRTTARIFKVHNKLSHAKNAIGQKAGRVYDSNTSYYDRPVIFHDSAKLWRWVNDEWQLMLSAEKGDLWDVVVPWANDPNWGKE